ncbi:MAG: two-component sensor histidine kinase [Oscillospiraceae bacterium]|nr:two-component sensor histidine kinase [Oscillospiraceae bacterium]
MRRKILHSTMLMAITVLLCSLILILGFLYAYYDDIQIQQLKDQLTLAATATEKGGTAFLQSVESSRYRLTWIHSDGTVIYDTRATEISLGNHLDREEFREAKKTGRGHSIRNSDTFTEKTIYEAVALSDGSLLRISVTRDSALGIMLEMLPVLGIAMVLILLLALYISQRMSKRIVTPINSIDPENPPEASTVPEIAPLLQKLHSQNTQITFQLRELGERAEEFRRISHSMQEGLILTDTAGKFRSTNPAAERIFAIVPGTSDMSLQDIDPTGDLQQAFTTAINQGHSVVRVLREGRYYRIDLSQIITEDTPLGVVLLAIDITESVNAQMTRRQFSANVSHELKTPLQTIMGSAELLETGLVKDEDRPRFYGHIRKEAVRLLDLVKDILRLSQLEEGASMTEETVDLKSLCAECLAELRNKAAAKNITLTEATEEATIIGIPQMLRELISNLCQNAILYNKEGGSLLLSLRNAPHSVILTVKDTGIGIPPEHQDKVFERFYRVDKSHSRASGGTGLGLSIVKHVAEYHKAPIALSSIPGIGTEITVTFPKKQ